MRLAFALALLVPLGTSCAAAARLGSLFQEPAALDPARPIEVSRGTLDNTYSQGGQRVSQRDVLQAVQVDPEASRLVHKGTSYQVVGAVCWAAGTVLLFWPLGQVVWNEHETRVWDWGAANWNLAAAGGVGWGIGLALMAMSSAHHAEAVDVYNDRFRRRAGTPQLSPLVAPAPGGRGGLVAGVRLDW
ncbi:MAG TPA: hypothetical protein VIV59_05180 [Anaeromyxobacteraceae bacterium]